MRIARLFRYTIGAAPFIIDDLFCLANLYLHIAFGRLRPGARPVECLFGLDGGQSRGVLFFATYVESGGGSESECHRYSASSAVQPRCLARTKKLLITLGS